MSVYGQMVRGGGRQRGASINCAHTDITSEWKPIHMPMYVYIHIYTHTGTGFVTEQEEIEILADQ
jgi:hypothetical protein